MRAKYRSFGGVVGTVAVAVALAVWLTSADAPSQGRQPDKARVAAARAASTAGPHATAAPASAGTGKPQATSSPGAGRPNSEPEPEPTRVAVTGFADPNLPEPPPPSPDQVSEPLPPQIPFDVQEQVAKRTEGLKLLADTETRLKQELAEAEAKEDGARADELRLRLARLAELQKRRRAEIDALKRGEEVSH